MDIKNLGSFTYRHDLNSVYFNDTQRTSFLLRHGESAIRRTLDFVLSEINAPEWEDIHLEGFLSSSEAIRNLSEDLSVGFSFIVYPKKGQEIETYTKEN
jgi:hypothetical protein